MPVLTESTVEEALLDWAEGLEYGILQGPDIAPGEPAQEGASYAEVLLVDRLRTALAKLNPKIPDTALDDAFRKVTHAETPNLYENNHRFHRMLIDGVDVEYHADGRIVHDKVWLVDFDHPEENDWLALNQYTVTEDKHTRRPDVVLFVNGIPLVVIELKNAGDENATTLKAFKQLQTYKQELSTLMTYNVALVASDGLTARVGTLTADWERFMPWRTLDGETIAKKGLPELEVLFKGVFQRARFLDLVRHFIDVTGIQRAVEDGATVKILYEGRLAKIELQESERPKIDPVLAEALMFFHDGWRLAFRTALITFGITISDERVFWIDPPPEIVHARRRERGRENQRNEGIDVVIAHCEHFSRRVPRDSVCRHEDTDDMLKAIRQFLELSSSP